MIDWERVAELREEIGEEDFGDVVELFLEEVEAILARLRDAPRPVTFEEDFHFLKGSALNLGFAAFGALCFEAEKASAAGNGAAVSVARALQCYDASKAAFLTRAAELGLAA